MTNYKTKHAIVVLPTQQCYPEPDASSTMLLEHQLPIPSSEHFVPWTCYWSQHLRHGSVDLRNIKDTDSLSLVSLSSAFFLLLVKTSHLYSSEAFFEKTQHKGVIFVAGQWLMDLNERSKMISYNCREQMGHIRLLSMQVLWRQQKKIIIKDVKTIFTQKLLFFCIIPDFK